MPFSEASCARLTREGERALQALAFLVARQKVGRRHGLVHGNRASSGGDLFLTCLSQKQSPKCTTAKNKLPCVVWFACLLARVLERCDVRNRQIPR